MTYSEAINFLYDLRLFGTKFGLENTVELARLAGHPHETLRFLHVAGTNGKGSTCAMLESVYRANGQRTGLFTSPHLISFTERIQVNRACISEQDVARLTARIIETLGGREMKAWPFCPTFFEVAAVMALIFFREQGCEIVLWETGMGGRLDATNIVTPLASVITNVQRDHEQWLGNTLEAIAAEKAGIIKRRVPVITGATGSALEVIRAAASAREAPLTVVHPPLRTAVTVPLRGEHQKMNAAVAIAAIETVNERIPVSREAIQRGLANVNWPGRLQLLRRGQSEILLDGAHNTDGAQTLAAALTRYFPDRRITLILGLFRDKPWREMCALLAPLAQHVLLVPLHTDRTADISEVKAHCERTWPNLRIEAADSVVAAIETALKEEGLIVIAGSLHLVGEAMERLDVAPGARSERSLNEWDAAHTGTPGAP